MISRTLLRIAQYKPPVSKAMRKATKQAIARINEARKAINV